MERRLRGSGSSSFSSPLTHSFFWCRLAWSIFRRSQGQAGRVAEQVTLLWRKLALETIGLDDLLTLARRHGAQIADGSSQPLPAVRWKVLETRIKLPRLLLLVRSEVFPRFHALQDAILLLRWKAIETLQPLS